MNQETITVAIVFGSIIAMITIPMLYSLAKKWIGRSNNISEEKFNRLAKAFVEYKEETQQRIQRLEALSGEEEWEPRSVADHSEEEAQKGHETIEIEGDSEAEQQGNDDGKLRNMLHE